MTMRVLHSDDKIVMTPPAATVLARQESKRRRFTLFLLVALFCVCAFSAAQLGKVIYIYYGADLTGFLS